MNCIWDEQISAIVNGLFWIVEEIRELINPDLEHHLVL